MVNVIFYNLLRSKYNVKEIKVKAGTIHNIVEYILLTHPEINRSDFESSVVFHKGKPIHLRGFDKKIEDDEEIIFTHFVGGG
jgi:hypothetical protein